MGRKNKKHKHPSQIIKLLAITTLLIGVNIGAATYPVKTNVVNPQNNNTLYVGGTGGENYTNIQDAIDNANNGDTIFVYGNVYEENIVIDKSIKLIGEDKKSTVIDGKHNEEKGSVVTIVADNVSIENFTIKNSYGKREDAGIKIKKTYCKIKNCTIHSCRNGIFINKTNSCTVRDSHVCHNSAGILLGHSSNNEIFNCTFYHNAFGIEGYDASSNKVINSLFHTNNFCIYLDRCSRNLFARSALIHNNANAGGIYLEKCNENKIKDTYVGENNAFGIWLQGSTSNEIIDSILLRNRFALMLVANSSHNKVMYCNFSQNFFGIVVGENSTSNRIHYNNFFGNLWNNERGGAITTINNQYFCDARYNWWNSENGPSRFILGKFDKILNAGDRIGRLSETGRDLPSLKIMYIPWKKKPVEIGFDVDLKTNKYIEDVNITHSRDGIGNDSDNDSCPDQWEIKYSYDPYRWDDHENLDPDNDGLNNVEEYLTSQWKSHPFKKDLFVEVDWMNDMYRLNQRGKQQLIDVFKKHNITLHIDDGVLGGGGKIPCDDRVYFNESRDLYWKYFLGENPVNIRKGIFHYAIISSNGIQTGRGGFAFYGWDNLDSFVITPPRGVWKLVGELAQRHIACVFMHELGHTLGLFPFVFRGIDDYYNVTYWSCMNYKVYSYVRLIDYSNGTHGRPGTQDDFDDWENLDFSYFKKSYWNRS